MIVQQRAIMTGVTSFLPSPAPPLPRQSRSPRRLNRPSCYILLSLVAGSVFGATAAFAPPPGGAFLSPAASSSTSSPSLTSSSLHFRRVGSSQRNQEPFLQQRRRTGGNGSSYGIGYEAAASSTGDSRLFFFRDLMRKIGGDGGDGDDEKDNDKAEKSEGGEKSADESIVTSGGNNGGNNDKDGDGDGDEAPKEEEQNTLEINSAASPASATEGETESKDSASAEKDADDDVKVPFFASSFLEQLDEGAEVVSSSDSTPASVEPLAAAENLAETTVEDTEEEEKEEVTTPAVAVDTEVKEDVVATTETEAASETAETDTEDPSKKRGIFSRFRSSSSTSSSETEEAAEAKATPAPPETALEAAKRLRAQAARIRLEAEKERVELNLQKIEKAASEIERLNKKKGERDGKEGSADEKRRKDLEEEMGRLRAQLVVDEKTSGGGSAASSSSSPSASPPAAPMTNAELKTKGSEDEAVMALITKAERIRLEAEKQRVELSLDKIDKVASQLNRLKSKKNDGNGEEESAVDKKERERLEDELKRLRDQLVAEEVTMASTSAISSTSSATSSSLPSPPLPSAEEIAERARAFQESPEFLQIIVARLAGFGVDTTSSSTTSGRSVDALNATAVVIKLAEDQLDYDKIDAPTFSDLEVAGAAMALKSLTSERRAELYGEGASDEECVRRILEDSYLPPVSGSKGGGGGEEMPVFTEEEIDAKVEELKIVPKFLRDFNNAQGFGDRKIAEILLEEEWETEQEKKRKQKKGGFFGGGDGEEDDKIGVDGENRELPGTFSRLFGKESGENSNDDKNGLEGGPKVEDLSVMMESLFPTSTRKEDETPTLKQVNLLLNDIVTPTKAFIPSEDPVSVPGGYIVRGRKGDSIENGDDLVKKIDLRLANDKRLAGKISVFYLKDPFPDPENQMLNPLDWPTVLFVAGPNVARDPAPLVRAGVTAVGVATIWYSSIYPFLVNEKLMNRVNDAMDLSSVGGQADMAWLTDMTIPMFATFLVLQLVHEAAHVAVAASREIELTVPTLIPSFVSGITSSITSLKTSPKNKQDLLDFAIAGPLAGMICSGLVLSYGLAATASADAASYSNFPALPLVVLRQSSLGGGLVDLFLGNGVLDVPNSVDGLKAVEGLLIPLHPLAVAGFFSLLVNALSLVPIGRTDGGRVSMALFGRSGAQAVTLVAFVSMFLLGVANSDILLFYFAFAVFFQTELEIPSRNEVDDVDFSRVILTSFAGFLMLLTLIPMS